MRAIQTLLLVVSLAGCGASPPPSYTGTKYLFGSDRCASAGAQGSPEHEACKKKLEQQDAQRLYNLRNSGQSIPGFQPKTSLP